MSRNGKVNGGAGLSGLPEGCIAAVILATTPRDACTFATISKVFKSAADSNSVWERLLPSDYWEILDRSIDGRNRLNSLSKKQLYFCLADRPLLIDGGTKSFSLEKSSGKKCYMIAARNLGIAWGDTPMYWKWTSIPGSRFPEVAELITVCWLDIRGKIRTSMLSPSTPYAAYFVFKMTEDACGFYDQSVELSLGVPGSKPETRKVNLDPQKRQRQMPQPWWRRAAPRLRNGSGKRPNPRADGWLEVEIGEFRGGGDEEVEMSVSEVKVLNWKRGLIVEGIEVRPKWV